MDSIISLLHDEIRSELLILTPVLYIVAKALHDHQISKTRLPLYLMILSILLAGIYTFAVTDINSLSKVLMVVFFTLIQGILLSGTAIFGGILADITKKITAHLERLSIPFPIPKL